MTTALRPLFLAALGAACLASSTRAGTVVTLGAGSAVTSVQRSASFDALHVNDISLSDYVEDGMFIGVSGDSWVGDGSFPFDPFHGASAPDHGWHCPKDGSDESLLIEATDGQRLYALEFLYGNGWTTGDVWGQYPWGNNGAVLEWQAWRDGNLVSAGSLGGVAQLAVGTVVGFRDAAGFDQLLLRATHPDASDPAIQALALDDLRVQLVPPSAWTDLGQALAGAQGLPELAGTGTLAAGSAGSLALTHGAASAPLLLCVCFDSFPVAFKGGTLVAFPPALQVALATSAAGSLTLPWTWPIGVPAGTQLVFQCALQDAAAPHGAALSNALAALTP